MLLGRFIGLSYKGTTLCFIHIDTENQPLRAESVPLLRTATSTFIGLVMTKRRDIANCVAEPNMCCIEEMGDTCSIVFGILLVVQVTPYLDFWCRL